LSVEDLNSTNGTRINGYKLDAGRAYRLRNGDELELGRLRLVVMVVASAKLIGGAVLLFLTSS